MGLPTDPLSHAGLTVAVVFAASYVVRQALGGSGGSSPERVSEDGAASDRPSRWRIDYRLVIIGSLLPDLIDRPLGLWFLPEMFNPTGRGFAHALIFHVPFLSLAILATPIIRSPGFLLLALCSAGHLLLDRMWESPRTLFWPQYGIRFGGAESNYSPDWLAWAQAGIGPIIFDATGGLVLLVCLVVLLRRGTFVKWLRTGIA